MGGGHFRKFAVSSRGGGHKKFKSYLFHHLSVPSFWNKGGGGQFSEVLMSIFWDEKLATPVIMKGWHKFLLHHTHYIWTREKEKILVWLVIIKLYLTERHFQAINIVVPTMFLPFYYTVLTQMQMCKATNFNLKASLAYGGNPYNLTHKPTF